MAALLQVRTGDLAPLRGRGSGGASGLRAHSTARGVILGPSLGAGPAPKLCEDRDTLSDVLLYP